MTILWFIDKKIIWTQVVKICEFNIRIILKIVQQINNNAYPPSLKPHATITVVMVMVKIIFILIRRTKCQNITLETMIDLISTCIFYFLLYEATDNTL